MTTLNSSLPEVFDGNQANALVLELAERASTGFGIGQAVPTGIPYFDEHNPPLMAGEIALIAGLTSHGKSLLASTIVKNTLDRLKANGSRGGVLVALSEETVEARRIATWGDSRVTIKSVLTKNTPLYMVKENIAKTKDQPIYFVGATTKLSDVGTRNGRLRASTVSQAIGVLMRMGVNPELVVADHAHGFEPDRNYGGDQERFDYIGDEFEQLAMALNRICPMYVLVQCNKSVEQRPVEEAQPTAYDLKYMQSLAAFARDIYTVLYPKKHGGVGKSFNVVQKEGIKASNMLFLVHAAKARNGSCAGETLAMTAAGEDGDWSNYLVQARFP